MVIGLGNPGRRYAGTRHNIGRDTVDRLADTLDVVLGRRRRLLEYGWWAPGDGPRGRRVALVRTLTFMNESGRAAAAALQEFKAKPGEMLVLLDDMDLPLGELRIRRSGSSGGHKGLGSVLEAVGTDELPRLRIGIGPRPPGMDAADWVLAPFSGGDRKAVETAVEAAARAARASIEQGLEAAMNRFNRRV